MKKTNKKKKENPQKTKGATSCVKSLKKQLRGASVGVRNQDESRAASALTGDSYPHTHMHIYIMHVCLL